MTNEEIGDDVARVSLDVSGHERWLAEGWPRCCLTGAVSYLAVETKLASGARQQPTACWKRFESRRGLTSKIMSKQRLIGGERSGSMLALESKLLK